MVRVKTKIISALDALPVYLEYTVATRHSVCRSAGLRLRPVCLLLVVLAHLPSTVQVADAADMAEEPPDVGIDDFIRVKWRQSGTTPAPRCNDRTFVRRVYLDLAGRIPTPP